MITCVAKGVDFIFRVTLELEFTKTGRSAQGEALPPPRWEDLVARQTRWSAGGGVTVVGSGHISQSIGEVQCSSLGPSLLCGGAKILL